MTVRKTLENHSQGGPILQALDNNTFDEISRRAFVRILVSELVEVYGSWYANLSLLIVICIHLINF